MKKLMLALNATLLLITPALTLSACRSDSISEIKNKNEIVSAEDFETHLAKSKLVSRSLIIAREKKWAPHEVLTTAVKEKTDLSSYFGNKSLIGEVLTAKYENFSKPEYWVQKDIKSNFILGLINQLYKDKDDKYKDKKDINVFQIFKNALKWLKTAMNTNILPQFLFDILDGKENEFIDVFVIGLQENEKLINKTYQDIFSAFPTSLLGIITKILSIHEDNKKQGSLKGTESRIKEIIKELPKHIFPMLAFLKKITDFVVVLDHEDVSQNPTTIASVLEEKYILNENVISDLIINLRYIYGVEDQKRSSFLKQALFKILTENVNLPFAGIIGGIQFVKPDFDIQKYIEGDEIGKELSLLDDDFGTNLDQLFNKIIDITKESSVVLKIQKYLKEAKNLIELLKMSRITKEKVVTDKVSELIKELFNKETDQYSWLLKKFIIDVLTTDELVKIDELLKDDASTLKFLYEKISTLELKSIREEVLNKILLEFGFDSSKQNFNVDSLLENAGNLLKNDLIKDLIQKKLIENKSFWFKQGNYVTGLINNRSQISTSVESNNTDIEASKITTSYDVIFGSKKFKFTWEFIYKDKKLITMKIVKFTDLVSI